MKEMLVVLVSLSLTGCSGMVPLTITEDMVDSAGKVISRTSTTVADASVAKEQAVHKTLQTESINYYKAIQNTGAKMGVKAYQEIVLSDGTKAYLPLMESSFTEAPQRDTHLPLEPSKHPVWGVAKDVVKYGALAYGVHEVSGLVSSLVNGARGIEITGDDNVIQGAQNRAGHDQEVRSEYVTCATGKCGGSKDKEQYIDENGKCRVSPNCSCESYEAGICE